MKIKSISVLKRITTLIWVLLFLAAGMSAHATTHIINFGGTLGETYSPNTLNVSVGDTIQWQGSFNNHPLSSTNVPAGALSFHQSSGSVFSYFVTVAGTYLYQCDFHASLGMTGSFTATTTSGVENSETSLKPDGFKLEQNFPNPFNPTTMISFDIPFQTFVSIKVYNLIGQEVATIVNENLAAGRYSKIWNAASMPSGVYVYRLSAVQSARTDPISTDGPGGQAGTFSDAKRLVLLK